MQVTWTQEPWEDDNFWYVVGPRYEAEDKDNFQVQLTNWQERPRGYKAVESDTYDVIDRNGGRLMFTGTLAQCREFFNNL